MGKLHRSRLAWNARHCRVRLSRKLWPASIRRLSSIAGFGVLLSDLSSTDHDDTPSEWADSVR
jgi:hypothetical protein